MYYDLFLRLSDGNVRDVRIDSIILDVVTNCI